MAALLQSALVSGWLELSIAKAEAVEATTKALPKEKIEASPLIASLRKVLFEELDVTRSWLFRQSHVAKPLVPSTKAPL
jgi:hypothetical protein